MAKFVQLETDDQGPWQVHVDAGGEPHLVRGVEGCAAVFVEAPSRDSLSVADRFWAKVDKTKTCWLWNGSTNPKGYGRFFHDGRRYAAHRFIFEHLVGPIPDGLQLDHLCRVRNCVNPAHLEPVTPRENTLRGAGLTAILAMATECPNGHPYTGVLQYRPRERQVYRTCLICRRERARRVRAKARA